MPQTYDVPEQYAGRTLAQIRDMGYAFQPGILGGFLGVGENQPLTRGQVLTANIPEHYANSGESQALSSIFGSGVSSDVRAQQQAATARTAAIAPAVASYQERIPQITQGFDVERQRLQGEVTPIKQRYQTVLDELKRRETKETGRESETLSREYGKRGVPLSSGIFDQNLNRNLGDISQFYGIQQREAEATQEESLRNITNLVNQLRPQEETAKFNITNALAQLQAGAGNASIEDAFRQIQFQEQQRQFQQQQALAQNKFDYEKTLTKAEKEPQYATLSEGQTLYDLLGGKSIFTAPKTYKPSDQFGGDDWEYI